LSGPAIGMCAALERARWGPWEDTVTMLPRSYATSVQAAGGLALLLPPDDTAAEAPARLLDRIDGLILAGGADVDPASYGAQRHPEIGTTWPERDRFEVGLVLRALDRGTPVLGVCRGMQLLNVARGGTLVQHLPDLLGDDDHRHTPGAFGDHEVRLEPASLAARAVGAEQMTVKSHHHQGIEQMGDGLTASGWSVNDDLVEAVELPDHPFVLGVLWHPEEDERSHVVGALVDAARLGVGAK
jgi:putative glutamine amidotransferase